MAKNITKTAKTAKTAKAATAARNKVGRPLKNGVSVSYYVTINVPDTCKAELDAIRIEISDKFGFGISYADTIRYLVKNYTNNSKG